LENIEHAIKAKFKEKHNKRNHTWISQLFYFTLMQTNTKNRIISILMVLG